MGRVSPEERQLMHRVLRDNTEVLYARIAQLEKENAQLRQKLLALADRVYGQSELLSTKAEKTDARVGEEVPLPQ